MGAVLPQVRRVQPGRDLRHPCDRQPRPSASEHAGGRGAYARRSDAAEDGGVLRRVVMAALLDQTACTEISHQLAGAEGPGCDLVAIVDAIGQSTERRRANRDHVAALVREAAAGLIAVA